MHFGSHFSFILYLQFECDKPGACHTLNVSCNAIDADRLVKPTKKIVMDIEFKMRLGRISF